MVALTVLKMRGVGRWDVAGERGLGCISTKEGKSRPARGRASPQLRAERREGRVPGSAGPPLPRFKCPSHSEATRVLAAHGRG